ncbi:unnamed protein product [Rotaria sordida]|uniref:Tetratricopeptide repeat protein n=1 Tax=Rotaria sordida TaxID=392033 RepID=A0A819Y0Y4_9BILA|nr:unnamed protein product [Rotaria sordida]
MNTISENSNSSINLVLSTSTTVPLKSTIAASPFSAIISTDLNNSISFLSEISAINDVTPITNISGSSATDPALATTYNNIGTIYPNQGNSQLALEHFQRALSIHLANPESNYEYIATEYSNIAAIFIDQGNLQEAFQCQQRSLQIYRKYLPSNHPYLAQSYYALAMSLYALGRYDEMFEYMQKALSIDKQSLPPNHLQTQFYEENMKAVVQRMFERIATGSIIIDDS